MSGGKELPSVGSQTMSELSQDPETTSPSGRTATQYTCARGMNGAFGDGERRSEAPLGRTPETRRVRVSDERVDALVMPSHSQRRHALR
jgi:hypothetical protein